MCVCVCVYIYIYIYIYTKVDGRLIGEIMIRCERNRSWPTPAVIPVFYKANEIIYGKLRSEQYTCRQNKIYSVAATPDSTVI